MLPQFKVHLSLILILITVFSCNYNNSDNICKEDFSKFENLKIADCLIKVPAFAHAVMDTRVANTYKIHVGMSNIIEFYAGTTSNFPKASAIIDTVGTIIRSYETLKNHNKIHCVWYMVDYALPTYYVNYPDTTIAVNEKPKDLEKAINYQVLYPQRVFRAYVDIKCKSLIEKVFRSIKWIGNN